MMEDETSEVNITKLFTEITNVQSELNFIELIKGILYVLFKLYFQSRFICLFAQYLFYYL